MSSSWSRLGVAITSLVVLSASCGSVDTADLADTTATLPPVVTALSTASSADEPPATSTTSTSTTSTSTTTTTTTTLPPVEPTASALVLSEMFEIGADLVDDSFVAAASSDPLAATLRSWEDAGNRYQSLAATPATAELVEMSVALSAGFVALYETYGPLLNDPATAEQALAEFLTVNTGLLGDAISSDDALVALAVVALGERDDQMAGYVAELLVILRDASPSVAELFGALTVLAVDEQAGIRAMVSPIEEIAGIGDSISVLVPPESALGIHERQRALFSDIGTLFGELFDVLESGSPDLSPALQQGLERIGTEGPLLNAARGRFVAEVLAGRVN